MSGELHAGEAYFVKSIRGLPWEQDDFLHLVYTGALERVQHGEVTATYGAHTFESARAFAVANGYWASHRRGEPNVSAQEDEKGSWVIVYEDAHGKGGSAAWPTQERGEYDYTALRANENIVRAALVSPTGQRVAEFDRTTHNKVLWVVRFTNEYGSTYSNTWDEKAQAESDYTGLRDNSHIVRAALHDPTGNVVAQFNRQRTGSGA